MATRLMQAACPVCGFPIKVDYSGQELACPACGENVISQGVTVPTWFVAGGIGVILGIFLGPAIIGSTEEGSKWLERQARGKIGR